jgi:hypothetical protein
LGAAYTIYCALVEGFGKPVFLIKRRIPCQRAGDFKFQESRTSEAPYEATFEYALHYFIFSFQNYFNMLQRILFCKSRGGAFLLLLLLSNSLTAQDVCAPIDCSKLKVEIVRVPHDNTTAGPNCPSGSTSLCGGGSSFQQMYYKVYLRYSGTITGNPNAFNLQYNRLNVIVKLNNQTSGSKKFSHVNRALTQTCFDPGQQWDIVNKVVFQIMDAPTNTVGINFLNSSTTSGCGAANEQIRLVKSQPTNTDLCSGCYYIELFTVVVNAYPGESIGITTQAVEYVAYDEQLPTCQTISLHNGGTHQGASAVTITTPATYVGTSNANLLMEILPSVAGSNDTRDFELRLKNNGTVAYTLKYVEFVVRVSSTQDITVASGGNYASRTVEAIGDNRYLHYLITFPGSGLTLAASGTQSISLVQVTAPNPSNLSWGAVVTFDNEEQTRLSTTQACTRLKTSGAQSYTSSGEPLCQLAQEFTIRSKDGGSNECSTIIQAGFPIPSSGQLNISTFEFELEFQLTGELEITGVNFDDFIPDGLSSWTCAAPANFSCLASGADGTCYDIIGSNVIRFCFSVSGSNAISFTNSSPFNNSNAFINILFNNEPGCIQEAKVRSLTLGLTGQSPCVPPINNMFSDNTSDCPPQVKGYIRTEANEGVEEVTINAVIEDDAGSSYCTQSINCDPNSCSNPYTTVSDKNGNFGQCVCVGCNCYTIEPIKDDNPLNGITTFDLVIISKHILGIEALGSPYKMIAADANKSNSITTLDIVEIRKLILGIYTEFPNNNSWRFVDANFTFPNPSNPWASIHEVIEDYDAASQNQVPADFIGIKIGDVNNTVVSHSRPTNRPITTFSWPEFSSRLTKTFTIPVLYTGSEPIGAFQFGFRYDTSLLKLIGPSQGEVPYLDIESFNISKSGEIKLLWLPMDMENPDLHIEPGNILFYLTFEVLANFPDSNLPLQFDEGVLYNAAWNPNGTEYAIQHTTTLAERNTALQSNTFQASIVPNPTSGEAILKLHEAIQGKVRFALFDAFGKRMFIKDLVLTAGTQEIQLPETARLTPGVYNWKVYAPAQKAQGHLIKQ